MNEPTINRGVLTAEIATRDTAWDYVGMIGLLTDPDPVLFKLDSGAEVLNSIMADAHLTSVCQTRKHGTLNREWSIEPGTVNNEEPGADAVALAEQFAADLYNLDVDGLINQILDAVLFGYVPIELMWAPDGGRIKLTNARALPFRWFGFNEKNEPRYISTKNMIDGEPIPTGKFVFARHQASFDNPYGVRLLSRAFWPVTFKRGGLKWWVKFAEKFGSPFVLGRYQNKDQAAAMLTQLKNMVQDAVATIPDGCAVDTLQSNVTGSTDVFDRLKTAMDSEISKLVLGQTLTTEVGDKGTQALGTVHKSVLEAYQASDQRLVETTMNEIAWVYAQINAPTTAAPVFQWQEDSDLQGDRADRDKILSDTGQVSFTKDYIVREYGFEDGDIEVKEKPDPVTTMLQPPTGKPDVDDDDGEEKPGDGKKPEAAESEQFSEMAFPAQAAIDRLIESIPPGRFQGMVEEAVKPVIKLISEGSDYSEVMEKLAEIYPEMDTNDLEEALARATFVAEVWGRLNAGKP